MSSKGWFVENVTRCCVASLTTAHTNVNANNDGIIAFNNNTGASGTRPSTWAGELVIRLGNAANTYNLGIRASTTAASTTYFSGDINQGSTTHLVVVRYTSGATAGTGGINDVWIDPSVASFGAAAPPSPDGSTAGHLSNTATADHADSIIIGAGIQSGAIPNVTNIDEIRVGDSWADVTSITVPEPATMAMFCIAALGALTSRRRRHSS